MVEVILLNKQIGKTIIEENLREKQVALRDNVVFKRIPLCEYYTEFKINRESAYAYSRTCFFAVGFRVSRLSFNW